MAVDRDEAVQAVVDGQMFVYSEVVNLAAGTTRYVGITTGPQPVMIDRRGYGTALKDVLVQLFEGVAFTGGTALPGTNRDRTMIGLTTPEPQAVKSGVTPGALPAPLFQLHLLDDNVVSISFGDPNSDKIRIAKLTNYVLAITNNDAVPGDFSWSYLARSCPG